MKHLKFEESDVQKIVFRADWAADCFTFDENGVLTGLIGRCELVSQLPNIEDVKLKTAHSSIRDGCAF